MTFRLAITEDEAATLEVGRIYKALGIIRAINRAERWVEIEAP